MHSITQTTTHQETRVGKRVGPITVHLGTTVRRVSGDSFGRASKRLDGVVLRGSTEND